MRGGYHDNLVAVVTTVTWGGYLGYHDNLVAVVTTVTWGGYLGCHDNIPSCCSLVTTVTFGDQGWLPHQSSCVASRRVHYHYNQEGCLRDY